MKKSNELLLDVFKEKGVKQIADEMGFSASFLYKWCHADGGRAAGALNALERLAKLVEVTGDKRPLHWLCQKADGYFVENPTVNNGVKKMDLIEVEHAVQRNIADFQITMMDALEQPKAPEQVARLRECFELLKAKGERLVRLLENGQTRQLLVWCFKIYFSYDAATPGGLIDLY